MRPTDCGSCEVENPSGCIPPLPGLSIDISDGTLEEKLASFVSRVTLMADLFQGAKH